MNLSVDDPRLAEVRSLIEEVSSEIGASPDELLAVVSELDPAEVDGVFAKLVRTQTDALSKSRKPNLRLVDCGPN